MILRDNSGRLVLAFDLDGERRDSCREQSPIATTVRLLGRDLPPIPLPEGRGELSLIEHISMDENVQVNCLDEPSRVFSPPFL